MNNYRPLHIYMMCGRAFFGGENQRSCYNNMYHASYGAFVPYHTFHSTVLCRHGGVDKLCTLNGGQYSGGACVRIFAQMLLSPQTFYQGDGRKAYWITYVIATVVIDIGESKNIFELLIILLLVMFSALVFR